MKNLVADLLALASARGFSQRQLALAAGIQEETLSRAKVRGSAQLRVVQAVADISGLQVRIVPKDPQETADRRAITPTPERFRAKHRALVWSNAAASDEIWMRRALVKPSLDTLVDAVGAFGLDRLEEQWHLLLAADDPEARKARPFTERLLRSARDGCQLASA